MQNDADNHAHELGSVPNCCNTQKMCDEVARTYPYTIQFVQEICDKAVNTCPSDRYITQELCDKIASEDCFMLKYCHDKYMT